MIVSFILTLQIPSTSSALTLAPDRHSPAIRACIQSLLFKRPVFCANLPLSAYVFQYVLVMTYTIDEMNIFEQGGQGAGVSLK